MYKCSLLSFIHSGYKLLPPIRNILGESKPITLLQTLDGSWSEWSPWSSCSKSCLSKSDGLTPGTKERSRKCDSPKPQNNGRECLGEATDSSTCSTELCNGTWEEWSLWSPCSESCGKGSRQRKRECSENKCQSIQENSQYSNQVLSGGIIQIDSSCNDHDCPRELLLIMINIILKLLICFLSFRRCGCWAMD